MPIFSQDTVVGKVTISERNGRVNGLFFGDRKLPERAMVAKTITLEKAFDQLDAYLTGKRKKFYLELAPKGTEFQHMVWHQLLSMPYGVTISFLEIARTLGKPTASRAVGRAAANNPIPIFIPCHRILDNEGNHASHPDELSIKQKLIDIERYKIRNSYLI